ncbi:MAG: carbon storage regulator [Lacipirellulaceae bacterium]
MLVLTRKEDESIRIGDDIVVKVVKTHGGRVRLAIEAPLEVPILRGELDFSESGGQTTAETLVS